MKLELQGLAERLGGTLQASVRTLGFNSESAGKPLEGIE